MWFNLSWILLLYDKNYSLLRMLKETAGTMELVHIADSLPGLKHAKGLSNWVLADKKGTLFKR